MSQSDQSSHFRARQTERLAVNGRTELRHQDWYSVEVRIRDLSTLGFMAECASPVGIGSYISLDVPGIGPVHAQVRWQIGGKMGGLFLDPIGLTRCEWMAEQADPPLVTA